MNWSAMRRVPGIHVTRVRKRREYFDMWALAWVELAAALVTLLSLGVLVWRDARAWVLFDLWEDDE